jgi:hypothetical protein
MFKRLFWLAVGAGFGFGMSVWASRAMRSAAERYSPVRASKDLSTTVRRFRTDLRDALAEGRDAMRDRERELTGKRLGNGHSAEVGAGS